MIDHYSARSIEANGTLQDATTRAAILSRGISVQIIDRIFKRNVKKYLLKWRKGAALHNGELERAVAVLQ